MQYVVPFYSETYEGLAETSGFIRLKKNRLQIEFQTKDAVFGVMKSGVKQLEVPLNEIVGVQYKTNIFRTIIQVTTTSFPLVEAFGSVGGSMDVKFRIKRKHKQLAVAFVENIQLFLAEYHLKMLEDSEDHKDFGFLEGGDEQSKLEE